MGYHEDSTNQNRLTPNMAANQHRTFIRRSNSADAVTSSDAPSLNRPIPVRRLSAGNGRTRFSKSPDLAETTFMMTTIEEENEITLSLKNLAGSSSDSHRRAWRNNLQEE